MNSKLPAGPATEPLDDGHVDHFEATPASRYVPRTDLGKRLLALREAAIRQGLPLLPVEAILAEHAGAYR